MTFKVMTKDTALLSIPNLGFSKKRCAMLLYAAKSLPPNTNFTLWINNVDMTWACQQPGGRMGDGLQSDSSGKIGFKIYTEFDSASIANVTDNTIKSTTVHLKDGNGVTRSIAKINEMLIPRT